MKKIIALMTIVAMISTLFACSIKQNTLDAVSKKASISSRLEKSGPSSQVLSAITSSIKPSSSSQASSTTKNSTKPNSSNRMSSDITSSIKPNSSSQVSSVTSSSVKPIISKQELPTISDNDLLGKINSQCKAYFDSKGYVGMAVGVIKNGNISYFNYGSTKKGGSPITQNTFFEIASMSKTFTGTLLGDFVVNGEVSQDDEVQKFFPDIQLSIYKGVPMQLINLANHTSGLPRMPSNFIYSSNPYKNYNEEMLLSFLRSFTLTKEPGTTYEYSNLGVGLLGYILSKVDNKPYNQILQERICNNLYMNSTSVFLTAEQQSRKASPYLANGDPGQEWDFDVLQACGGVKSTTRDYLRFVAANLGQIDTDNSLKSAMQLAQRVRLCWQYKSVDGGKLAIWHDGLVGGYSSYTIFVPEAGIGVVVFCNNADTVIELGDQIIQLLF
jgi:CubicO group peptidase (beta-lactamase class C family)